MKNPPKVHAKGGHGVDVRLHDSRTTNEVYWSPRSNSFVLVAGRNFKLGDRLVDLLSINGIGEIRWSVPAREVRYGLEKLASDPRALSDCSKGDYVQSTLAFKHFGLELPPQE